MSKNDIKPKNRDTDRYYNDPDDWEDIEMQERMRGRKREWSSTYLNEPESPEVAGVRKRIRERENSRSSQYIPSTPEEEKEFEELDRMWEERKKSPEYIEKKQKERQRLNDLLESFSKSHPEGLTPDLITEIIEIFAKTLNFPRSKSMKKAAEKRETWYSVRQEYQEMRNIGYLKKPEAISILSKKYDYAKSTIEKIIYSGRSY